MKTLKKALVGTAAATAMAVSATPALAKDHKDGIGAGEVIAGAVVLGGLAAILSSSGKDKYEYGYRGDHYRGDHYRGDRYRGDYRHRGYRHGQGGARRAVNRCIRAAERRATRNFGWADVTQIRDVDRTRYGWRVKGRIVVNDVNHRGRYHRSNYRHDVDRGKFTCYFERGSRPQIRFRNLDRGYRW